MQSSMANMAVAKSEEPQRECREIANDANNPKKIREIVMVR
jgi:hypothetical protein